MKQLTSEYRTDAGSGTSGILIPVVHVCLTKRQSKAHLKQIAEA